MIKTHSDDPDLPAAAEHAAIIVAATLAALPKATGYDYGGHELMLGEYDVCVRCTTAIAEAQHARDALKAAAEKLDDELVIEHILLAAELLDAESRAAEIRAKLHNGTHSEQILNSLLGFMFERDIKENFDHSHHAGDAS